MIQNVLQFDYLSDSKDDDFSVSNFLGFMISKFKNFSEAVQLKLCYFLQGRPRFASQYLTQLLINHEFINENVALKECLTYYNGITKSQNSQHSLISYWKCVHKDPDRFNNCVDLLWNNIFQKTTDLPLNEHTDLVCLRLAIG